MSKLLRLMRFLCWLLSLPVPVRVCLVCLFGLQCWSYGRQEYDAIEVDRRTVLINSRLYTMMDALAWHTHWASPYHPQTVEECETKPPVMGCPGCDRVLGHKPPPKGMYLQEHEWLDPQRF